jgi:hypothetical protein
MIMPFFAKGSTTGLNLCLRVDFLSGLGLRRQLVRLCEVLCEVGWLFGVGRKLSALHGEVIIDLEHLGLIVEMLTAEAAWQPVTALRAAFWMDWSGVTGCFNNDLAYSQTRAA